MDFSLGQNDLLAYAITFTALFSSSFCINTAPNPFNEASVSTTKVFLKSGYAKTGGVVNFSFNNSNASLCSSVQTISADNQLENGWFVSL